MKHGTIFWTTSKVVRIGPGPWSGQPCSSKNFQWSSSSIVLPLNTPYNHLMAPSETVSTSKSYYFCIKGHGGHGTDNSVRVRPCPRFPDYFCINFTYIYYLYYYYTNPTAMKHGSNEIRKNHESKTVRAISNKHQTEIIFDSFWPLAKNEDVEMQYLNMLDSHDIVSYDS